MPLYVFICKRCGGHREIFAAPGAEADKVRTHPPKCLLCKRPMTRHYGNVSIRFKGDGWSSPSKIAKKQDEE